MKKELIIGIILVFLFSACKTPKIVEQPKKLLPEGKLYKEVLTVQSSLSSVNFSRINLNLAFNGKALSVKGYMKIKKDSIISISIQPMLGFEATRMEISPDSIIVIDKINKQYSAESFSFLAKKIGIPINFYNLQAVLLNQLFVLGEDFPQDSTYMHFSEQPFPDGKSLVLKTVDGSTHYFVINPVNRIALTKLYHAVSNSDFSCEYGTFKQEANVLYPSSLKIMASSGRRYGNILLEIAKADFNTNFAISKTNLSSYTKVKFEQIIP
jgi:hypothetical protein